MNILLNFFFYISGNIKLLTNIEENIPPRLELHKRLPDDRNSDRFQHVSAPQQQQQQQQQYGVNIQEDTLPIGSLSYGQVTPINYGYRPLSALLKVRNIIQVY